MDGEIGIGAVVVFIAALFGFLMIGVRVGAL